MVSSVAETRIHEEARLLTIDRESDGTIVMAGRLDAEAVARARPALAAVTESCRVDCSGLDYISSAGIGLLVATQRRLSDVGGELELVGLSPHLLELLRLAGLGHVFDLD
jgi:anti-sigma B factor antagonist